MGNLSCLFHGVRRAGGYKNGDEESSTPNDSSNDSGFYERDPNDIHERKKIANFISALRYLF